MARNGRSSGTPPDTFIDVLTDKAESASGQTTAQATSGAGARTPMKSQKLDRTLKELESAFTDWEAINSVSAKATGKATAKSSTSHEKKGCEAIKLSQTEKEFREKTKKLLNQLRQQLAELND